MINFIFMLTAVTYIACKEANNSNLIAVVVTHRHGERNIFKLIQGDPYADASYWKEGYGELRIVGKQHHFKLGKWFRKRYNDFVPRLYSPQFIRVQSTDFDRTLMSVSSHLAGFYPPKGYQIWNSNLKWQPIPIHTRRTSEDAIVAATKPCKKYDRLYDEMQFSPEMTEKKNETVLRYLSKHTRQPVESFIDLIEIQDTLFVEENDFGFTLPKWTDRVYEEPLNSLSVLAFKSFAITEELARLKMGPFFHEVITNLDSCIAGDPCIKYSIYSAHDLNIANILESFKIYNDIRPPYASAIIFELRQNEDSSYYINILYKNSTVEDPPVEMTLPECDFDCNYENFKRILKPITIDEMTRDQECKDEEFLLNSNSAGQGLISVASQGNRLPSSDNRRSAVQFID